jgi:DNA-binding NarL/FixJ family response regulator
MPNRNGLESMLSIKKALPEVKVIIVTVSDQDSDLFQALRLGADGYVLKLNELTNIVDAVKKVVKGESVLSPELTSKVIEEMRRERNVLTPREREILDLVAQGMTNTDIADKLFITPSTVNTYIYRLLQKLHLKNRAEAIAYSLRKR